MHSEKVAFSFWVIHFLDFAIRLLFICFIAFLVYVFSYYWVMILVSLLFFSAFPITAWIVVDAGG